MFVKSSIEFLILEITIILSSLAPLVNLYTLGENATEIWLADEYPLLPVKIRHVDNKGKVFVQVATEVLFGL
jgi:hypothetical protein